MADQPTRGPEDDPDDPRALVFSVLVSPDAATPAGPNDAGRTRTATGRVRWIGSSGCPSQTPAYRSSGEGPRPATLSDQGNVSRSGPGAATSHRSGSAHAVGGKHRPRP